MTFRLTILILLVCFQVEAADKYLRVGATGTGSGNNWTDAYTTAAALESGMARGDVGYVAAGTYPGRMSCNTAVSSTSVITIRKATVADHGTDTGWQDSYATGQADFTGGIEFLTSYWLLDGVSRTSWTSGYGIKVTHEGIGVYFAEAVTNVTVQYVEVAGHGDDQFQDWEANHNFYSSHASFNIQIRYCYPHDSGCNPFFIDNLTSGLIEHNWVARNESYNTPLIEDDDEQHSEGIYGLNNTRLIVRYNVWEDIEGTGVIVVAGSGIEVYGNVIFWTGAGDVSNGSICGWSGYSLTGSKFYNNTIYVPATGGTAYGFTGWLSGSGNTAYNNLFYCSTSRSVVGFHASFDHDWNGFGNVGAQSESNDVTISSNPFISVEAANFRLTAPIGAGTVLGSPYNEDIDGITHPTPPDIGAYAFVPAATTATVVIGTAQVINLIIGGPQ